ncbi:hypothetical protein ACRXB1_18945, partial [Caballeronia sp. M23-90]
VRIITNSSTGTVSSNSFIAARRNLDIHYSLRTRQREGEFLRNTLINSIRAWVWNVGFRPSGP